MSLSSKAAIQVSKSWVQEVPMVDDIYHGKVSPLTQYRELARSLEDALEAYPKSDCARVGEHLTIARGIQVCRWQDKNGRWVERTLKRLGISQASFRVREDNREKRRLLTAEIDLVCQSIRRLEQVFGEWES